MPTSSEAASLSRGGGETRVEQAANNILAMLVQGGRPMVESKIRCPQAVDIMRCRQCIRGPAGAALQQACKQLRPARGQLWLLLLSVGLGRLSLP